MSPTKKTIFIGQRKLKQMYPNLFEYATKEGSRVAANQYWLDLESQFKERQSEYDAAIQKRQEILQAEVMNVFRFVQDRGGFEELEKLNGKEHSDLFDQYQWLMSHKQLNVVQEQQTELIERKNSGIEFEQTLKERSKILELPDIPLLDTIVPTVGVPRKSRLEYLVEEHLGEEAERLDKPKDNERKISKTRYKFKVSNLHKSVRSLGDISVNQINEISVRKHFKFLDQQKISETSKRDKLVVFEEFIEWLHDNDVLQSLPKNWKKAKYRFYPSKKTPEPATLAEAHYVLKALRDKNRPLLELSVLLHLNCGMESGNTADLQKNEVDLKTGTITYKRNKADKHNQIKPVKYPLWKSTLKLLKELESDHKELWLLNENGKHLNIGETGSRNDNIGQQFTRFKEKYATEYPRALKDFRKTGSTELKELGYRDLEDQFLQHGANTTTDQWYSGQFRERFLQGVRKLEPLFKIKEIDCDMP